MHTLLVAAECIAIIYVYNTASHVAIYVYINKVMVKPHHEEDIFVITRGRGGAEAEV